MADFIDAGESKTLLGCDDATLNNYVNNGTIRAQRVDGQLMLHREDVINLAGASASDSDDGTIILSGDSEDLSIDLGEVVDDSAVTMVQNSKSDEMADSITFGDELEVVNFDDEHNTEELTFEDTDATQSLTFTDSNTAVATDVDETVVGTATATATATSDFQTVEFGDTEYDQDPVEQTGHGSRPSGGANTVRRSVRSQRTRRAAPKTHWIWPTLLILTMLVSGFFVYPYFVLATWKKEGMEHLNGDHVRGLTDYTIWTNMADGIAGFSVEPDEDVYHSQVQDGQWISIAEADPLQVDRWRYKEWRGRLTAEQRAAAYDIKDVTYDDTGAPIKGSVLDDAGQPMVEYNIQKKDVAAIDEEDSTAIYKPVYRHQ